MNYNGFTIIGDFKSLDEKKIINLEIDSQEKKIVLPVKVPSGIVEKIKSYENKFNKIAIKGRFDVIDNKVILIADKLTFLAQI